MTEHEFEQMIMNQRIEILEPGELVARRIDEALSEQASFFYNLKKLIVLSTHNYQALRLYQEQTSGESSEATGRAFYITRWGPAEVVMVPGEADRVEVYWQK